MFMQPCLWFVRYGLVFIGLLLITARGGVAEDITAVMRSAANISLMPVAVSVAILKMMRGKRVFLAGGVALETPFGTFYSPNITPDIETGIGNWDDADFIRAMRYGFSPQGYHYYPAFPYTSYAGMTRQDLIDLKAYLFSLPAINKANKPHELTWVRSLPVYLTGLEMAES